MPRRDPRGPLFPGFPRPDLEIPGGLDDLIIGPFSPSRESCAECRSRQDPRVMHIADPCMNQCSGGAGGFELPDPRLPDPTFPKPRPGSMLDPFDFPPVNSRDRGVGGALIPAAQLLGEFLGRLMK